MAFAERGTGNPHITPRRTTNVVNGFSHLALTSFRNYRETSFDTGLDRGLGAIVLTGLSNGFVRTVESDQRIDSEVAAQVGVAVGNGIDFVDADQVRAAAEQAGLDEARTDAVVEDYSTAQLRALKVGLFAAALLALLSLMSTRHLPHEPPVRRRGEKLKA